MNKPVLSPEMPGVISAKPIKKPDTNLQKIYTPGSFPLNFERLVISQNKGVTEMKFVLIASKSVPSRFPAGGPDFPIL